MGRPSKLTPATSKAIRLAIMRGATLKDAARAGGVHVATVLRWLARGKSGKGRMRRYAAFSQSVIHARRVGANLRLADFCERNGWSNFANLQRQ